MTNWEPKLLEADRLHDEAMGYATQARLLGAQGKALEERVCLREAYELAAQAAGLIADVSVPEPSRSVIHRSAASLAMRLGDNRAARELVLRALDGGLDERTRWELELLLDSLPIVEGTRINHANAPASPRDLLAA